MSKEMRELLSQLAACQTACSALQSKEGVTEAELNAKLAEINTIKAKIAVQKAIDEGKTFSADGIEVQPGMEPKPQDNADPTSSLEYRRAFMNYCRTGERSSALKFNSLDAMTTTTEAAAVIPSTILQEVIRTLKSYGQLYARVRKLMIKGGVTVPISTVTPTATWITQAATSDKKQINLSTNVSFSYYGLECKISTSLLADAVTLDIFEKTVIELIGEAIAKALDTAIISGAGTTQPIGITIDDRVPAGNKVSLSPTEFQQWDSWKKKVFAKMPLRYKGGATFIMASGTFEGYIDGLVDANGQPIGRTNFGITNGPQESFGGKEVILVEDDIIASYDDANTNDIVAIYCNLNNYAVNSNMQLTMFRYFDHDTNEWINKAILIADGKLLDPAGVILIKKGA